MNDDGISAPAIPVTLTLKVVSEKTLRDAALPETCQMMAGSPKLLLRWMLVTATGLLAASVTLTDALLKSAPARLSDQ